VLWFFIDLQSNLQHRVIPERLPLKRRASGDIFRASRTAFARRFESCHFDQAKKEWFLPLFLLLPEITVYLCEFWEK